MKIYECNDCIAYGGKEPCYFILGDGAINHPMLCPCADIRLPDAKWKGPLNKVVEDGKAKCAELHYTLKHHWYGNDCPICGKNLRH